MSQSSGEPLEAEVVPNREQWIACWQETNLPIIHSGSIGAYIPVWDNPIAAREWAQAQSKKKDYYVREVEMLYLPVWE